MELGLGLTKIIPPIVYLIGIVVILLTLFYKIEFGIYFLVPILTQQSLLEHMGKYPLGKDFIDLLFMVLLIKWFFEREKVPPKSEWQAKLSFILPAIFLWTLATLWIGSYVLQTGSPFNISDPRFLHWKNFIMLPMLYLIVVNNVKDEKQIKIIILLMTVSMLYMDRSFYNNFADKDRSSFRNDLRVGSTFSYLSPNELAVFYAQNTIILLSIWMFEANKKLQWLFGITTVFNYYCLMFLYSRGGYLAALMSWIFYGIVKDRRFLVAIAMALIFWQTLLPVSVQQRINMSQTSAGTDSSIEARYEMWDQAMELISQRPLFGIGYNTTPYMGIQTEGLHRNSLHNGYVELLMEQGAVGLLIFLTFFIICFRLGWRLFRTAEDGLLKGLGLGYSGCVLAVLAGNFAGSYWFYLNVSGFYWVLLGLVVRALSLETQKREATAVEEPKISGLVPVTS